MLDVGASMCNEGIEKFSKGLSSRTKNNVEDVRTDGLYELVMKDDSEIMKLCLNYLNNSLE